MTVVGRLGLPDAIRACLFDLDGVLTDTASVHAQAWTHVFSGFGFDDEAYRRYVDGRRRSDGARAFLAARGIAASESEIAKIAREKDDLFLETIRREGVRRYEGSVAYARAVVAAGLPAAIVSASRHCAEILESAGLAELFAVRVDGVVAATRDLRGKPAPDTFLHAAELLGLEPAECAVFEDALAGVEAGRAGGFGWVVGIARGTDPAELVAHGADVAVADLDDLRRP